MGDLFKNMLKQKLKALLMASLPSVLMFILPIIVITTIFGGILTIGTKLKSLISSAPHSGSSMYEHQDNYDEAVQLYNAVDSGTITEADLEELSMTKEDFLHLLKAVIDANKPVEREFKVHYTKEEWTKHSKTVSGTTIEWWQWDDYDVTDTFSARSYDTEKRFYVPWQGVYTLCTMAVENSPEKWSEDRNSDMSIAKVKKRISQDLLDNAIDVFTHKKDYVYDVARDSTTDYYFDNMDSYTYVYEEGGDWEFSSADGSVSVNDPTDERTHTRWRRKIPVSVLNTIYNEGIDYGTTAGSFSKISSYNTKDHHGNTDYLGEWKINSWYVTDDPQRFAIFSKSICPEWTYDYFCTSLWSLKNESVGNEIDEVYDKYTDYWQRYKANPTNCITTEELTLFDTSNPPVNTSGSTMSPRLVMGIIVGPNVPGFDSSTGKPVSTSTVSSDGTATPAEITYPDNSVSSGLINDPSIAYVRPASAPGGFLSWEQVSGGAYPSPTTSSDPVISNLFTESESHLGLMYVWGGTSPISGFDCSGFVQYSFRHSIGIELPRVSRDQYSACTPISAAEARPGDLVFRRNSNGRICHVMIYAGHGIVIHSPHNKANVTYVKLKSFDGLYFGRIIP